MSIWGSKCYAFLKHYFNCFLEKMPKSVTFFSKCDATKLEFDVKCRKLNYFLIEGVNIEYGNIENCKFDSVLRSKN